MIAFETKKLNEVLTFGLKSFFFLMFLFFLLRVSFIFFLRDYIGEVEPGEIFTALFFGERLSCQTAGILTLPILISFTLQKIFDGRKIFSVVTKILVAVILSVTVILSAAEIPFYRQFHSGFNQMIFAGLHDDFFALFVTFVKDFQLPLRLLISAVAIFVLYKIFFRLVAKNISSGGKIRTAILLALYFVTINLSIFGGGWNWQTELNFENVGVTKSKLLNESALDSFQAINRARILQERFLSSQGLNFTGENVKILAAGLAGKNPDSDNLTDYLRKFAGGEKISKPKHVFIIISESLANWALLEKYSDLHIADGLKKLARENFYCPTFLPNGASTISAVTGIVTGFADANLYLTTMPECYEKIFPTSSAPQMQRLGYRTNFFYAGSATWERIADFTSAQGFEKFFGSGDVKKIFPDAPGNVWGIDDKFLYAFVEKNFDPAVESFNVILNVSNHSPYTVDLAAEGIAVDFPDEEISRQLGHYKYAANELCKFVEKIRAVAPESLFVIVGDHADRYHPEKNPTDYERFCVPLIIVGDGVKENFSPENCAGSQIDILPTIFELIAPKGFEYYSVGRSLDKNFCGVNYALFITRNCIGNANISPLEPAPLVPGEKTEPPPNLPEIENYINAVRGISFWAIKNLPLR